MSHCLWAKYCKDKSINDEILEIINDKEYKETFCNFAFAVAGEVFSSISMAKEYLAECYNRNFIPWVALFAERR